MLLRSAARAHEDSRYDIMVACPIATITTQGTLSTIDTPEGQTTSEDDPFTLVETLMKTWTPPINPATHDLPFVGGALGFWGYDLGRRIERLPSLASPDVDMPDMAIGIYEWAVIVDHHKHTACLVGQNPEQIYEALRAIKGSDSTPFLAESPWCSNMTRNEYRDKIEAIHHYHRTGDCYQINLTQRFTMAYRGSEWEAYCRLEQANQAPFSGFIRIPQGCLLSLSPERLLEVDHHHIETKPIKGTMPRDPDAVIDQQMKATLRASEKDQAENLMIVDLLRNDIGRVAKPGSVNVPKLFNIESFPAVHHLVSTITATLDEQYSYLDLLRACFPGGSITGAPKIRAMEIIEELEPHRRNAYCGSIGYISRHGRMDTNITIRTLIACQQTLYVWAGGGIVSDSQWDHEYQETFDKLSKILPILTQ